MERKLLRSIPLFADLNRKDLKLLARHADEVHVESGFELTKEGRNAYEFFVILDGTATVHEDGDKVRTMGPNEFFGEIGLLGDHRRTATVTAARPMRLLVMFGPEFSGIADQMPEVHDEVRRVLAERLNRA